MSWTVRLLGSLASLGGIFLTVNSTHAQTTIYVEDDASSGGDGASWQTAFKYLQDALATAKAGDNIRVGWGIYKPDQDEGGNVTPGDREGTFQLINGVTLRGGQSLF